jgi:hypothetical protein
MTRDKGDELGPAWRMAEISQSDIQRHVSSEEWARTFKAIVEAVAEFNLNVIRRANGKFGAPDQEVRGPDGRKVVRVNFMHVPPEEHETVAEVAERSAQASRKKFVQNIRTELESGARVLYMDIESAIIDSRGEKMVL